MTFQGMEGNSNGKEPSPSGLGEVIEEIFNFFLVKILLAAIKIT